MTRHPWLALTLALGLAGLAPTTSFGDLSLSVTEFDSPTFIDGSSFQLFGTSTTISLTPGVPLTVTLDDAQQVPINPILTFTGDAGTTITLGGISQSFSDSYTFPGSSPPFASFSGGSPIIFNLGPVEVTVTPIASDFYRKATFLESPAAVVPEPSFFTRLASSGLAAAAIAFARRPRKRSRA
jgi:hypothetical protein